MRIGDRVMVEYPGYALHKRMGTVALIIDDDFLGRLYTVAIEGAPPVALPARCLREIAAKGEAA